MSIYKQYELDSKVECINGFDKQKMLEIIDKDFKGQAMTDTGACAYLTDCGKKCAVGLFLPKEHPATDEPGDVCDLVQNFEVLEYLPLGPKSLVEFQNFHDQKLEREHSVEVSKRRLKAWVERNVE